MIIGFFDPVRVSRSKNVPVKKCPGQKMSQSNNVPVKQCPGQKSVPVENLSRSKYHIQNIPIRVSKSKYTGQKYYWVKKCPGQNITFEISRFKIRLQSIFKISRFKIRLRSICRSKFNLGQYFSLNIQFKIRLRLIFSVKIS